MNFLDQIQQDQDAAKSDLNSMLNQKAFDLLDSYAAGPEIEVVTFDEDESSLTEEDLDSIDEEQLDEEQLDEDSIGKTVWTSHTGKPLEGKIISKDKDRNLHYIVALKSGNHSVHDDHIHFKEEYAKYKTEELHEGVGNLVGLSKHLLKTVTGSVYSGRAAGEHSEVESHPIKNKSAHRAVLNKALDDGHVPVVYVNGKIHSAGHSTGAGYSRPEFNIHDADKQKEQKETIYPKPRRYGGKIHYSEPYHTSNPRYSKGDALDQLTPGHEASFYKENKVEVKVVKADKVRQKMIGARKAARPETQNNYVNSKPGDKAKNTYMDSRTKTSTTSAGDNLKAIKDAAALRLATKKLGGDGASANKKAMDLHAELGKHLAAGKHREAIHTANALADHVRNQGLTTHADKIADYAKSLKDLKSRYDKGYAKKRLASLRGETNESEELVQALELMLTEMLDINDQQLDEAQRYTKETGKKYSDQSGQFIGGKNYDKLAAKKGMIDLLNKKSTKNEEVELAQEAVVPGSVKKDKDGNVLSFKSVGDDGKKLVKDRKTGKMYDPEAEFDKLISKKK